MTSHETLRGLGCRRGGPRMATGGQSSMKVTGLLMAAACGASIVVACGGSATSGNDNGNGNGNGNGNDAAASSSSGAGSSSGSSSDSGEDATTGVDGAAGSCQDSSGCSHGQVCCASIMIGGAMGLSFMQACAASCPAIAFQLCSSNSECKTAGETCTRSPIGMGSYCAGPPPDGGGFPGRGEAGLPFPEQDASTTVN